MVSVEYWLLSWYTSASEDRKVSSKYGSAIAQAVSRWLNITATRVRAQARSCGIYGGQSVTGIDFLRVLRFPLPNSFHRLLHTHHLSTEAGAIGQLVADVPSRFSLTPTQETKNPSEYRKTSQFHNYKITTYINRNLPSYSSDGHGGTLLSIRSRLY
jgi:hypothetical protein